MILAPSMLAADFLRLGDQLKEVEDAGVKWLHVDVMDGTFVPSISFGMPVIESIRRGTGLFFDVHLMITEPARYIEAFKKSGADLLTVHVEACGDTAATLKAVREAGLKVGLSLNPETEAERVFPFLKDVDLLLVMSVHPGFGGQKFIPESLEKIGKIREYADSHGLNLQIEVDGGINADNIKEVCAAGADVCVAGTAVFRGNIADNVALLTKGA